MSRPLTGRQQLGVDTIKPRSNRRIRRHARKFKLDGTASLSLMPDELLLEIVQYLHLPDLESLSVTCKQFHDVFSASLSDEQTIARDKLRGIAPRSDEYGYHDLLIGILRHEINPNYIKRLDCRKSYGSLTSREEGTDIELARYIGWTAEDLSLVRASILRATWLKNITTPDELIEKMVRRDEDAVLALLVPLLKNLSLFLPPVHIPLLRRVFVKIARVQIEAELTNPNDWQRLPLRKLHTIYMSVNMLGTPFADTFYLMSLPSVRRIFLDSVLLEDIECMRRTNVRSLTEIPRSRASVVYIRSGEIQRNEAEIFADYIIGPCVLRQYMYEPMPEETEVEAREAFIALQLSQRGVTTPPDLMSEFWDHCTISPGKTDDPFVVKHWASQAYEGLDSRTVEFSIKYRAFHYEDIPEHDLGEYEVEIKQAGIVPSPEWLALTKWNHYYARPENLDDYNFRLEE